MKWMMGIFPFEQAQAALLGISFVVFLAWIFWAFRAKGREVYDQVALLPLSTDAGIGKGDDE
ncbi:cbb3-type cytochrome c oxidase subunit 3 [Bdellovibrionota bacterium FG-2]